MKHKIIYITSLAIVALMLMASCSDDDSFSSSRSNLLSFEVDTLSLDTVFSTVPSPNKVFMVRNNSSDGIRISSVRLQNGNQTGFRVNVNGTYLSEQLGYQTTDMELRKGDSLRVFVEITSATTNDTLPKLVTDNLLFNLESGVQQTVCLEAYSWDAYLLDDVRISNDSTISNLQGKPVVVYGGLTVGENATLTIAPGTTIYFHDDAGIDVDGTLKVMGEQGNEVTLRCDRLDRMVSNLMYDNNPGQWQGITLGSTSTDNVITYADIHGSTYGVVCDVPTDTTRSLLSIDHSTLHNIKGNALEINGGIVSVENTQISNALGHCLYVNGGNVSVNSSTIAQYYPFDSGRGYGLYFQNSLSDSLFVPVNMTISNSIIKGYANDEVIWTRDTIQPLKNVVFDHCLLRTERPEDFDSLMFTSCIFEDVSDTLTAGRNSFVLFDTGYFFYDFTPAEGSLAIGAADPSTSAADDRYGKQRDAVKPDMGCFETDKTETDETEE